MYTTSVFVYLSKLSRASSPGKKHCRIFLTDRRCFSLRWKITFIGAKAKSCSFFKPEYHLSSRWLDKIGFLLYKNGSHVCWLHSSCQAPSCVSHYLIASETWRSRQISWVHLHIPRMYVYAYNNKRIALNKPLSITSPWHLTK